MWAFANTWLRLLILSRFINKHGRHRQFLFLIGRFFLKSFPLKPLGQMNRNLVGSIYGRSSIEIANFGHYERFIWYFFCWESSIKSQNIEIRINLCRNSFTLVTSSQSMSSILYRGPGWPSGYGHLLLKSSHWGYSVPWYQVLPSCFYLSYYSTSINK